MGGQAIIITRVWQISSLKIIMAAVIMLTLSFPAYLIGVAKMPVIAIQNLTYYYPNSVPALAESIST